MARQRTRIVLVVEDDPTVRAVLRRMLAEAGYQVVEAKDGQEAWSYLQRPFPPVDLLLTDVVMPRMTGTELASLVATHQPELPIVLMSGYSTADLLQRGLELSHGLLLTKPFGEADLLARVTQALRL